MQYNCLYAVRCCNCPTLAPTTGTERRAVTISLSVTTLHYAPPSLTGEKVMQLSPSLKYIQRGEANCQSSSWVDPENVQSLEQLCLQS